MSDLLTVAEAAKAVHLSKSFLNKARGTGRGPSFIKAGAKVLYRRADLDNWLDERVRQSTVR